MWKYASPIGDIFIKRLSNGTYGMIFDNDVHDCSINPQALADNVYTQHTGCDVWDDFDIDDVDVDVPSSIDEWEKI